MSAGVLLPLTISAQAIAAPPPWATPDNLGCGTKAGIAASGSLVHVIRQCGTELHYHRSANEGETFAPSVPLASGVEAFLQDPLDTDGTNVFAVYFRITANIADFLNPRVGGTRAVGDLYMRRSRDGGLTWDPEIALTTGARGHRMGMDVDPSGVVHIAFMNFREGDFPPDGNYGTWDVRYLRGVIGGDGDIAWTSKTLLSGTDSFGYERPAVEAAGDKVHLVWMHPRAALGDCAANAAGVAIPARPGSGYMRSDDAGVTWPSDGVDVAGDFSVYASRPGVAFIPPSTLVVPFDVHVEEAGNTGLDAFVAVSKSGGDSWEPTERLTATDDDSTHGFASAGDGVAQVVWHDVSSGSMQVHLREYLNPSSTWCPIEQVSASAGSNTPLSASSDSYLHVVWLGSDSIGYRRRPERNADADCDGNRGSGGGGAGSGNSGGSDSSGGAGGLGATGGAPSAGGGLASGGAANPTGGAPTIGGASAAAGAAGNSEDAASGASGDADCSCGFVGDRRSPSLQLALLSLAVIFARRRRSSRGTCSA